MKSLAILVAEDEVLTRLDIRGMLERAGHVVCGECGNGRKAVELARQLLPDLALLDIMMPEMDGIEALKGIKGIDANAKVVMCSAMGQQGMVMDAIRAGAADFIVKPFDTDRVIKALDKVI